MKGDTLFSIGAMTAVGSVVGYLVAAILTLLGTFSTPDVMAWMLVGFLSGLVLMAAGWALGELQKGT